MIFCVGAATMLRPTPVARAPQVLRWFAKGSGIVFEFDERGRLASGPEAERLFSQWVWRLTRATGCFAAGLALSRLLLSVGPPLSRSTPQSIAVTVVACGAIVGPYLILRPFLRPLETSNAGTVRPAVVVEDYLSPPLRVLSWLAAASVLVIPVAAVALAMTRSYDGSKIFWEGLVAVPLVSAGVLLAAELESPGARDSVTDLPAAYLRDLLRSRALRVITACGTAGAATAWSMASAGLVGVSLAGSPRPSWVDAAHADTWALSAICAMTALTLLIAPVRRFRRRLWPGLASGERVRC